MRNNSRNCVFCGKEFIRTRLRNLKYCSVKCSAKSRGYTLHLMLSNENKKTKTVNGKLKCNICNEMKLIEEFPKVKQRPLGVDSRCKQCENKRSTDYHHNNIEKVKTKRQTEEWKSKNREFWRKWSKKERETNVNYRMKRNLRARIWRVLKKNKKLDRFENLTGCTILELKEHLERKFTEGMSWNNYGKNGWEVDHILPCSKFDLVILENQLNCFNYKNLQPLWAADNLKKSNK